MEVNEYLVKVQGTAPFPVDGELSLGDDVSLRIEGTVVKEEASDNQDGTKDVTYVVKGILSYKE